MTETPANLQRVFETFKLATMNGLPGVMRIQASEEGPTLGITACTYGDSPCGLAVFDYLLNTLRIHEGKLKRGTLYLVINNIDASESYFAASNDKERDDSRWCVVNMNRLPLDTLRFPDSKTSEIARANKLFPIWQEFDVGLDIHSIASPTPPMIISRKNDFRPDLIRGFPISILITNIDQVQWKLPAFSFYGGKKPKSSAFAIEAGQHTDPATFECAKTCAIALLQNMRMLEGETEDVVTEYQEYEVIDKVTFSDYTYEFSREFKSFEAIPYRELIAYDPHTRREWRNWHPGHIIFPNPKKGRDKDLAEEMAFLTRPVRTRRVQAA